MIFDQLQPAEIRPFHFVSSSALKLAGVILAAATLSAQAWQGMPTPTLHVDGNTLKDPNGNVVVLRSGGIATSDIYNKVQYGDYAGAVSYIEGQIAVESDSQTPRYGRNYGWYANCLRLSNNPRWVAATTDDSLAGAGYYFDDGLASNYVYQVLVPVANYCQQHGMYLITDIAYIADCQPWLQDDLERYWRIVSQSPLANQPNVLFEVFNEPLDIQTYDQGMQNYGDEAWAKFREWIQPVVDTIRQNGANNIVIVGSPGNSSTPQGFVSYPVQGSNIAYSLHFYPGGRNYDTIYSTLNNTYNTVASMYPLIVTEFNWNPSASGNEAYEQGTTSDYGQAFQRWCLEQHVSWDKWMFSDMFSDFGNPNSDFWTDPQMPSYFVYDWFYNVRNDYNPAGTHPPGPAGWTWCAYEGGTVNFSTPVDVAYGINNTCFCQYNVSGNFLFANSSWGGADPDPGVSKSGFYLPFAKACDEWNSYYFDTPVEADFGANGSYDRKWGVAGTVYFDINNWNDPLPGVAKAGYYMPYNYAGPEGSSLSLPFPVDVAFGANGQYYFRHAVTGTITFNTATWGDPCVGTPKAGYWRASH